MLASLEKIQHPLGRGAAAAGVAFATTSTIAALILGFGTPKNETAHRVAVLASLMSAGGGALFGLFYSGGVSERASEAETKLESPPVRQDSPKQDWRDFVVIRKVIESQEITSFYLKPVDGGPLVNFQPGQFLTIKLDIPEQARPVIRTYSLSDYGNPSEYYRLSIKREGSPKGSQHPPGLASNFLHDRVAEGAILLVKPPSGRFFLNVSQLLPAVLISNGVGITPMMAMAKACLLHGASRPLWFVHGARNGEYHAFRTDVLALAEQNPQMRVYYRYSQPRSQDEGQYHSQGYADIDFIKTVIAPEIESLQGAPDAEYFLCGSPAFTESLLAGLREWGVSESHIFFESFGPAAKPAPTASLGSDSTAAPTAEVVFSQSGKTLPWRPEDGTILELAEANGLNPPYSCRQGICLTCLCAIAAGEVAYEEPPIGEPDPGSVLICVGKPKTPRVVLNL